MQILLQPTWTSNLHSLQVGEGIEQNQLFLPVGFSRPALATVTPPTTMDLQLPVAHKSFLRSHSPYKPYLCTLPVAPTAKDPLKASFNPQYQRLSSYQPQLPGKYLPIADHNSLYSYALPLSLRDSSVRSWLRVLVITRLACSKLKSQPTTPQNIMVCVNKMMLD